MRSFKSKIIYEFSTSAPFGQGLTEFETLKQVWFMKELSLKILSSVKSTIFPNPEGSWPFSRNDDCLKENANE
tara:strand:- start:36995 stop:37213 length:219 start_codon:yes stop_codon:yes gene_type:complete